MKFGPNVEKAKGSFNKYTDYKVSLICFNCRTHQEVVILKGVSVKMALDAGRECSYCRCGLIPDKEGKIPYSFW
jgi:hypothetical protein